MTVMSVYLAKSGWIQCEDILNSMDMHCCCQTCIVHLDSTDSIAHDQSTPLRIYLLVVRQQRHRLFDGSHSSVRFNHRQSKPIAIAGPRAYIPKLAHILRSAAQFGAHVHQTLHSTFY